MRNDINEGRAIGGDGGTLVSLRETGDFEVADGYPDVKGWDVKADGGRKVGEVHDLLFDRTTCAVRYMDVELDRKRFNLKEARHVLVPIGSVRLDDDGDDVLLNGITDADLLAGPAYRHDSFDDEYEQDLGSRFGGRTGDRDLHDERGFWGSRHQEGRQALVRSEEELAVGTRRHKAGEVEVEKHTTTEHVRKDVPVTREEVTVERRPVSGDRPNAAASDQNEIRVPVYEEEVVTEKRMVPKEEVVIRKQETRGTESVEADLRKERVDVDVKGKVRRGDGEGGKTGRPLGR